MGSGGRKLGRLWKSLVGQREPTPRPHPESQSPAPSNAGIERRRLPRVRVLNALHGYGVEANARVTVKDVSLGGFAAESTVAFDPGSEHTFLFTTADDRETMVRCECRHARTTEISGVTTCVAGFQFLPDQEENLRIIVDVFQRLRTANGTQ